MKPFQLASIIQWLGPELIMVVGDANRTIGQFAPFDSKSAPSTLTFYSGHSSMSSDFVGAVFCRTECLPALPNPAAVFLCTNSPRLLMIRAMTAVLTESGEINDSFGPVRVGANVKIHHSAVIGARGFGFERNAAGVLEAFPHIGGVLIGDDVEIRANVTVDRGTLTNTVIGSGTKIDHGAYIGHNVQIGQHSLIMAGVVICGSAQIGDYCSIAPSATIRDGVRIGNGAFVGLGAVVVSDVDADSTVIGVPAKYRRRSN